VVDGEKTIKQMLIVVVVVAVDGQVEAMTIYSLPLYPHMMMMTMMFGD
jgi:hypothetical protein